MARFVYEAKKTPQDVVKGVLVADNKAAAVQKIAQMGYYIISLDEESSVPSAGAIVRWLVGLTAGLALLQMTDYFIRFWPPISRPIQAAEWAVYIGSTMLSVLALPAILVTLLLACRPAPDSSFGSRVGQPAKV